jgi:lipoic acid synthetase
VAYAVAQLGLAHAVITSVNRDDDNLGAAQAFVDVIHEIRAQSPGTRVEVLTPDFQGVDQALRMVVTARPDILNHNIETVPRLYGIAKSGGRYARSLEFLRAAKAIAAETGHSQITKTGIIVGLGEEMHELLAVFRDLADRRVDILTIGQYLRPSRDHLVMQRFYTPTSSPSSSTRPSPWASATSNPARWSAPATTPSSNPKPPAWRSA